MASGRLALALGENRATEKCYKAADEAMSGVTNVGNCVFITKEQTTRCLNSLHHLLGLVYREKFDRLQAPLEKLGL